MNRVFVYGTLRENLPDMAGGGTLLGPAITEGRIYNLGAYPAVQVGKFGGNPIVGEVWEVTDQQLRNLDRYEGYPNLYQREQIETPYGIAYIYTMKHLVRDAAVIESGDWFDVRRVRN